jgi:hypothetical protein
MEEDEALVLASKLGLESNGELKSISVVNITHPSLEKALNETKLRDTDAWEILENKTSNECHRHEIIESNLLPIDIYEETPLEFEKGDHIDEHGSYFINTSSNPCSYEKSLTLSRARSSTPSFYLFINFSKGWLLMHMFIINIVDLIVILR